MELPVACGTTMFPTISTTSKKPRRRTNSIFPSTVSPDMAMKTNQRVTSEPNFFIKSWWIWLVVGGIVLIAGISLLLALTRRRKRKADATKKAKLEWWKQGRRKRTKWNIEFPSLKSEVSDAVYEEVKVRPSRMAPSPSTSMTPSLSIGDSKADSTFRIKDEPGYEKLKQSPKRGPAPRRITRDVSSVSERSSPSYERLNIHPPWSTSTTDRSTPSPAFGKAKKKPFQAKQQMKPKTIMKAIKK